MYGKRARVVGWTTGHQRRFWLAIVIPRNPGSPSRTQQDFRKYVDKFGKKAATQVETPRLLRKERRGFCHSGDALRFDAIAPTAAFLLSGPGARFARAHSSGDDAQSRELNGAATSSVVALLTGAQPSPPHKSNSAAPAPTQAHRKSSHLVFVIPSHSISPQSFTACTERGRTFCLHLQTPSSRELTQSTSGYDAAHTENQADPTRSPKHCIAENGFGRRRLRVIYRRCCWPTQTLLAIVPASCELVVSCRSLTRQTKSKPTLATAARNVSTADGLGGQHAIGALNKASHLGYPRWYAVQAPSANKAIEIVGSYHTATEWLLAPPTRHRPRAVQS